MNIIFICGSLEPGKDGVGDYTRRLCAELINQGVHPGILSFNDKDVVGDLEEKQSSDGKQVKCYRISNRLKSKKRKHLAKKWIETQNPEWLSLQFVPYSFQKKGLPFNLLNSLRHIEGNYKWHIMFHELWLGLRKNDSIKFKIIGFLQESIVKSLLNGLNIETIHTHTQFYLDILKSKLGLKATYLPIFSNIPFEKKYKLKNNTESEKQIFVVFGTIHYNSPIKQFAKEVSSFFEKDNNTNKFKLLLIGKSGNEREVWVTEFESLNMNVEVLGELSESEISIVLQKASYGITTNPIFVVEKSGTVAAMREHNLPILIVSENTSPRNSLSSYNNDDLFEYRYGNFNTFMRKKFTKLNTSGILDVASQFSKDLGFCTNK